MGVAITVSFGLVFAIIAVSASYPLTYPFENEIFVPAGIVAATPSFTFETDGTDPGGYLYHHWYRSDPDQLTEDKCPYSVSGGGPNGDGSMLMYGFVHVFETSPVLDHAFFNCSVKELKFKPSDFTGVISNQKICNVGECCSFFMEDKSIKYQEDQIVWHEWLETKYDLGMCGELKEHAYCWFVSGDQQTVCSDYIPSPTERIFIVPCHDAWVLFWMTCPVFKASFDPTYPTEPPSYLEKFTVEQMFTFECAQRLGDKLCHPDSYFTGQTAQNTPGTPGTDDSGTDDSGTDSGSSIIILWLVAGFLFMN